MIYLWCERTGWKEFELSDKKQLKKRGIDIASTAYVGDGANIPADTTPKIICIIGSRHPLSYWGEDRIDIGCEQHTIAEWIEHAEAIGKNNEYTDEEIAEYLTYTNFVKSIHEKK